MEKEWKFIGVDLGAESGRCVAAIFNGEKITLHETHRFTTHCLKNEKGFFWDLSAIYNDIIEGLKKTREIFGPDFDGIAVDTWGVDYVLIDQNGNPLSDAYHYRDNRTDGMMEKAFRIAPKETIYKQTGIQFAQYNTLFQLLAEKKTRPQVLNSADKFLMMPDFFNFMLSGVKKAEYSIASTTSLTNPHTRNWSQELITVFDLPGKIFPEMAEPGTKLGSLLPKIAAKTGLNPNVPVFASAGHDTASAVAAIPAQGDDSWAFLSSGTWSLMGIELSIPLISGRSLTCNFTNEGGVCGSIRFLKNIIGLWPLQECRRYWLSQGNEYSYAELMEMAKSEGYARAWINLDDERFLKPGDMPAKIISYLKETNQPCKDRVGFISAVILESLAFTYRKTFKEIENIAGVKINKLHIAGGGSQNTLLTQYTADAIGRPVYAGPVEASVTGNISFQALAAGAIPDLQSLRRIVSSSFEVKLYEPINPEYFNENEELYLSIINKKKF
ncbi:MAG TPA: rhamnulokinase family protein [Ignavibacteriales bacterium]|nr:rhamnulokinase family protein [Ignavibacteriales bacterium]